MVVDEPVDVIIVQAITSNFSTGFSNSLGIVSITKDILSTINAIVTATFPLMVHISQAKLNRLFPL